MLLNVDIGRVVWSGRVADPVLVYSMAANSTPTAFAPLTLERTETPPGLLLAHCHRILVFGRPGNVFHETDDGALFERNIWTGEDRPLPTGRPGLFTYTDCVMVNQSGTFVVVNRVGRPSFTAAWDPPTNKWIMVAEHERPWEVIGVIGNTLVRKNVKSMLAIECDCPLPSRRRGGDRQLRVIPTVAKSRLVDLRCADECIVAKKLYTTRGRPVTQSICRFNRDGQQTFEIAIPTALYSDVVNYSTECGLVLVRTFGECQVLHALWVPFGLRMHFIMAVVMSGGVVAKKASQARSSRRRKLDPS